MEICEKNRNLPDGSVYLLPYEKNTAPVFAPSPGLFKGHNAGYLL
jgi:hypothetical protein